MLKSIITAGEYAELPEVLQAEYKKEGEEYHLDSDGNNKVKEFRNNNIELRKQIEKLMADVKNFEGIDITKYQEAMKKLQEIEDKQLIDAGQFDELFDKRTERMRSEHSGQVTKLTKQLETAQTAKEKLNKKVSSMILGNELASGLDTTGLKLVKGGMEYLRGKAATVWQLQSTDDDELDLVPMAGKDVIYGKDGKHRLTMAEWLTQEMEESPFLFEGNKGGGAGGNDGNGAGGIGWINSNDTKAFSDNLEKIASGEVQVRTQ